jgi:hypothetical protein
MITKEQIEENAKQSAEYLRSLISNGVDLPSAVELTKSFSQILLFSALNPKQGPKEPWET